MTPWNAPSFRHLNLVAAIVVAALIAAACGGDDTVVKEPTTTDLATTTQPVAPETAPNEEPAADEEADPTVEPDAASTTTTTEAEADNGEAAVTDEEPDGVPADEPPLDDIGAASEGTTTPVTTVPSDEAPEPEEEPEPEEQPQQEAPTAEGSTEDTTSPQPEPEPEPELEQQPEGATTEAIVCVRNADGVHACPQVIPDGYSCENVAGDLICRPPRTEPEPDPVEQPEVSAGDDIVCVRQPDGLLLCSQEPPADYWCENIGDTLVCHPPDTKPKPEQTPQTEWTPPVAGMVPEVHPDAPLREWEIGDGTVNPDARAYDYPRLTQQTLAWADWCSGVSPSCRWLMHEMHQALDYLGADPQMRAEHLHAEGQLLPGERLRS